MVPFVADRGLNSQNRRIAAKTSPSAAEAEKRQHTIPIARPNGRASRNARTMESSQKSTSGGSQERSPSRKAKG